MVNLSKIVLFTGKSDKENRINYSHITKVFTCDSVFETLGIKNIGDFRIIVSKIGTLRLMLKFKLN